jgi:4,5-dihydroxyphthalate decarboxylase
LPKLPLTPACWNYDRTRPLMDGSVKPDGIDLDLRVMRPREAFPRMLQGR